METLMVREKAKEARERFGESTDTEIIALLSSTNEKLTVDLTHAEKELEKSKTRKKELDDMLARVTEKLAEAEQTIKELEDERAKLAFVNAKYARKHLSPRYENSQTERILMLPKLENAESISIHISLKTEMEV